MKTKRPSYPDGPYACGQCEYDPEPCALCKDEWRDHMNALSDEKAARP